MEGVAQTYIDIVLETQLVLHDGKLKATVQFAEGHIASQKESSGSNFVTVHIRKTRPLHTIKPQHINTFAHASKTRIGVSVRIRVVSEDRRLLCIRFTEEGQQQSEKEGYMIDFRLQIQKHYCD